MQNSRNTRSTIVIIAGFAIALVGRALDWSLFTIFLLLALLIIVMWLVTYWQTWRTLDWFRRYNYVSARVREGESHAVIAELTALRDGGDRSPETAITLAAAYSYLGRGQEAEPLALEAFDTVAASPACGAADLSSRALCDLAHLTRYDTMLAQGRFTDAAGGLREHISDAIQPNFLTALTAWAYFLGDDRDQTRHALERIKAPGTRLNNERLLSPRFEFTVAYLRRILNDDTREETLATLRSHQDIIDEWDATAERNAQNPYGARLNTIVDDMRAVAADLATESDST